VRTICPVLLAITLTGCSWFSWGKKDEPSLPPATASKATPVDTYADAADRVMEEAAAAVTIARDANSKGKPDIVEGELSVASSLLPRPTPKQIQQAQSRADANNPVIYAEAVLAADRLQRQLDTLWAAVESQKAEARLALAAKQQELDAARAAQRDLIWTGAGLLIVLLAIAGIAWGSSFGVTKIEAGIMLLIGLGVGSLPWMLESDLSAWVLAPAGALVAIRGVMWVWSLGKRP
jgi:hypothetical protein